MLFVFLLKLSMPYVLHFLPEFLVPPVIDSLTCLKDDFTMWTFFNLSILFKTCKH